MALHRPSKAHRAPEVVLEISDCLWLSETLDYLHLRRPAYRSQLDLEWNLRVYACNVDRLTWKAFVAMSFSTPVGLLPRARGRRSGWNRNFSFLLSVFQASDVDTTFRFKIWCVQISICLVRFFPLLAEV